ncbi:hypothetical protein [Atlantibacter hermannii]|uniref:hypothetical protein n=1 Tax=Atlantibacter hermannii TaxID=565 RepID=UPI002897E817|nr:hypothetical protein [Atlantibacter hermannii]
MSDTTQFDFKRCWLALTPDERDAFADEAGTTSHYIQTHLTGKRKLPGKRLMDGLFKAARSHGWVKTKPELATFFYS